MSASANYGLRSKTQAYFADILYISPSYLALIEAGKRVPNLDVLVHIAEITDVSIDYLILEITKNQIHYSSH